MPINVSFVHGKMLIGGELIDSESGDVLESVNPATEESIGTVPAATAADVDRAVVAAAAAHPAWAALEPKERARLVRKLAQRLREEADSILRIEVMDTGNTIAKMRADVASAGDTLDFYAGFATEIKGETIPASATNLHFTLREPYGVVGRIIPFNHPIKFAANALAAPLMAGNCVVLKPPETSPLSASHARRDLPRRAARAASSISSPATACRPATRSPAIRASSGSPSPARCRPGAPSSARRAKAASSTSRSSSAARTR